MLASLDNRDGHMNGIAFLLLAPVWWALALLVYAWLGDSTPDGQARVSHFFDRLERIQSKGAGDASSS
jgi:hypothetical protein